MGVIEQELSFYSTSQDQITRYLMMILTGFQGRTCKNYCQRVVANKVSITYFTLVPLANTEKSYDTNVPLTHYYYACTSAASGPSFDNYVRLLLVCTYWTAILNVVVLIYATESLQKSKEELKSLNYNYNLEFIIFTITGDYAVPKSTEIYLSATKWSDWQHRVFHATQS